MHKKFIYIDMDKQYQENTQTSQQLSSSCPEMLNIASGSQPDIQRRTIGYKHRQPRKFLPEGDEKDAHEKQLARIRSTDYNTREKDRRRNLTTQLQTLENENKQLKSVHQQLQTTKTRVQKIYDRYSQPNIPPPSQESGSD